MLAALVLSGCAATGHAPVGERVASIKSRYNHYASDWRPKTYTVQKGDTLFGIALEYGFGYREIAEWNGIDDPNRINTGQVLRLTPPNGNVAAAAPAGSVPSAAVAAAPAATQNFRKSEPKASKLPYSAQTLAASLAAPPAPPSPPAKPAAPDNKPVPSEKPVVSEAPDAADSDEAVAWIWPTSGKTLAGFSEGGNKGLDIGGKAGQPVLASADGKVVYSGSGLRGYGNLIIIKHNNIFLTAYAHNSKLLVKEGQLVKQGQKIAEMGSSDSSQVMLHFEIRRLGKPADPLKYLPAGKA
ncbi:MAG: peptidoglycan DD-metalloendopeptidase family protein [Burkholderiales bacterium]